jgi:hypothetical protein
MQIRLVHIARFDRRFGLATVEAAAAMLGKAGEKVTARNVFVDLEFQKAMVWVRNMSGLCSSLTPSTTLTGREVRKARADIKRTMDQLHALDAKLAAIGDHEGTGRPTRPRG